MKATSVETVGRAIIVVLGCLGIALLLSLR